MTKGGSPAQADIIIQKLKLFAHKCHIPLYTFGEEVCTGVGYYILSAGDHVYVDQSTQVGSITEFPKFVGFSTYKKSAGKTSPEDNAQAKSSQPDNSDKECYEFSNKK